MKQLVRHFLNPSVGFVVSTVLLYAPKYIVGSTPPMRVTLLLVVLLVAGAWLLARGQRLMHGQLVVKQMGLLVVVSAAALVCILTSVFNVYQLDHFVVWVDSPRLMRDIWLVLQGQGIRPVLGMDHPPQSHVSPTMLLLLPWHALFPSHPAFLFMRNVLMAGSAIPLFLIARRVLPQFIAVIIALSYLVNFTIFFALTGQFYEMHLFPPIFLLACWCFERGWYGGWLISLFLIGGIREEMGFALLGFAALAFLRKRPTRYWLSAVLLGCAWLVVSYEAVLGFHQGGYTFQYVFHLEHESVVSRVINNENGIYLYQLGLPFMFVFPFMGWSCLPAIPILMGNLYVKYPLAKVAFLSYSLPVVVGFFYALTQNMSRLVSRFAPRVREPFLLWFACCLLALNLTQSFEHFFYEKSFRTPLGGGLSVPLSKDSTVGKDPAAFESWLSSLREATRRIPEGCRASTPAHMLAQLPHQWDALEFDYSNVLRYPEYIMIDGNAYYKDNESRMGLVKKIAKGSHYVIEYQGNGVTLYRSVSQEPLKQCSRPVKLY